MIRQQNKSARVSAVPAGPRLRASVLSALILAVMGASGTFHPASAAGDPVVERGRYLVSIMSCNDCHTPWKMGPNGPEPDQTRLLSGHPQDMKMPPAPALAMPWSASVGVTMTAWAGPWGVSFPANLTPDAETGLGKWTEEEFVATMKSGRHMGRGRPILPPMPYPAVAALTDEDAHALFTYLRSIPAIKNQVPQPIPPAGAPGGAPAAK